MKSIVLLRLVLLLILAGVGILIARGFEWSALAQSPSRTYTMDQKNTAFGPQRLVIPRGATVTFENHDVSEHNVTLSRPQGDKTLNKDLGTFPPGQKVSYTFEQSGVVRVHCKIHPEMTATITVR
jgi:plastocyanin